MVTIHAIHSCPREWPDNEICASVQHSVFATRLNSAKVSSDYELTADHLKQMWDQSANSFLQNISLCVSLFIYGYLTLRVKEITLLHYIHRSINYPTEELLECG